MIVLNLLFTVFIGIMSFSFLILIHELGHFLISLKRGIKVSEFSIGFGPSIFSKEFKNIKYKIGIFPLGGYVKMPENPLVKGSNGVVFKKAKNKDKLMSIMAGPAFNIISGYILMCLFLLLTFNEHIIEVSGAFDFVLTSLQVFGKSILLILKSFIDLFTGSYRISDMTGPIGITNIISQQAKNSLSSYVFVMSIISINIGIFNLLSFPALDGSRALFIIIESFSKKKISIKNQERIHLIGFVLLLGLITIVSFNDFLSLF